MNRKKFYYKRHGKSYKTRNYLSNFNSQGNINSKNDILIKENKIKRRYHIRNIEKYINIYIKKWKNIFNNGLIKKFK